jgi:chorismate dehydratase
VLTKNHPTEVSRISSRDIPSLTIAASSYLNSAPLLWSFLRGSRRGVVDFVEAVPAQCAQLLSQREVEAALVPVIEYQRISEVLLVPDVCVGSKEEVLSVVLVSRKRELREIETVALDESSRTSATLVKVIFREFLENEPRWMTHTPNVTEMLERNDAALIIGDPAMAFSRTGVNVWDMARLWRNYTGLGFVFAMWMVKNEAAEKSLSVDFGGAKDQGLNSIDEIVGFYQDKIPLSAKELRDYLMKNIVFSLDDSMRAGLQLYFELAHKHRLIEKVKPLAFTRH